MKPRAYFPLGRAKGLAFCNRTAEQKKLRGNIRSGKHTLLIAPRRYGKSSLCEQVLKNIDTPSRQLDFHIAVNASDVERIIVNGVAKLINKTVGSIEKLFSNIASSVKYLKPKLAIGNEHMQLELEFTKENHPAENIAEAITLLDRLLQEKNKSAVLLFDEFQEVGLVEGSKGLEGAIRHAAQDTSNLSIIFSGSNPHMLSAMFEDERRPLYKLCRKIILDRIEPVHYQPHLEKAALQMWDQPIDEDVFNHIMQLTEQHPYYVNYLCDEIWSLCDNPPNINDVNIAWETVCEEEQSDLLKDFMSLSDNQKKTLLYLTQQPQQPLYSHEATIAMGISVGSIQRALATLVEKDYVFKVDKEYRVTIPLYKLLLKRD